VQTDLSFIDLVSHASPLVQMVMAILMLASAISWFMIVERYRVLRGARKTADLFEQRFWSGIDLGELYRQINSGEEEVTGQASIFNAGFREFARLKRSGGIEPMAVVEGARRSMHVALSRELDTLENNLSFLATVGSISPYVGLFGTVWGILNAFHALGNVKQATLAMVAPGIAEALIATAMGLFAAIPAVVAYNRFAYDVERLHSRFEEFLDEFTSILQRQAHVN
jgi:biopolymer transport protein TolQ